MPNAARGAGGREVPPGNGGQEGHLNRRTQIIAALIGAVAAIAGAALGIVQPWSHATASRGGGTQLAISSMSMGHQMIKVRGTVRNLGAGENVYAFAAQQTRSGPWYPSKPAVISGESWAAVIAGLPSFGGGYSVWAGTASGCPDCAFDPTEQISMDGPHAQVLIRVTRPRHVTLPSG